MRHHPGRIECAVNPSSPSPPRVWQALPALLSRSPRRYRVNLVYQLPVRRQPPAVRLPSGMCWFPADRSTIIRFFRDDDAKRAALLDYPEGGNLGVIVTRGREWVAYGWVGTARTGEPLHLARVPLPPGAAWVVHCRTREGFRGRGVYKFVLRHLVAAVREADPEVILYIDTPKPNRAARRGIVAAGFEPAGVVRTPHCGSAEGQVVAVEPLAAFGTPQVCSTRQHLETVWHSRLVP